MSDYSIFPNGLDGYAQIPLVIDGESEIKAADINRLRSAIVNIERHIGIGAAGSYDTITERINDIDDFDSDIDAHINGTENPHLTSLANLVGGTLAELNDLLSDATLDDSSSSRTPTSHASSHYSGGSDPIEATSLKTTYSSSNYSVVSNLLSSHLEGIDNAIGSISAGDVSGPASSTNNALVRFDGTTGKIIKNSSATLNGSGDLSLSGNLGVVNISPSGTVDGRDIATDGTTLDSHVASTANPHNTSIANLNAGTLAQLNSAISDADLISLSAFTTHTSDTTNPHSTDIGNLGSGTLAELNSIITDATLDDSSDSRTPTAHASSHESGGADEIDGDNLAVSYSPTNYSASSETLSSHLSGLDTEIAVNQETLEVAASKFVAKLDMIKFQLSLITGVDIPEDDDPDVFAKLDDIILLFSLITGY